MTHDLCLWCGVLRVSSSVTATNTLRASICRLFHHTVTTMTFDHSVASDTSVPFAIPLVVVPSPATRRKDHLRNFGVLQTARLSNGVLDVLSWAANLESHIPRALPSAAELMFHTLTKQSDKTTLGWALGGGGGAGGATKMTQRERVAISVKEMEVCHQSAGMAICSMKIQNLRHSVHVYLKRILGGGGGKSNVFLYDRTPSTTPSVLFTGMALLWK
jgi:hypothetical protein